MKKLAEEGRERPLRAAEEAAERVFVEWVVDQYRRDRAAAERGEAA